MTETIVARFSKAGLHHWPTAPRRRAYLAFPHRHLFKVAVECGVDHGDRAVEFHDLVAVSARLFGSLGDPYPAAPELVDFGAQSCETLARNLGLWLVAEGYPIVRVVVSEDGENDGVWESERPGQKAGP